MRLGSRMSTRGERCAYFEGAAYLLDFRCFLDTRGDVDVATGEPGEVSISVVVHERFADGRHDAFLGSVESFSLVGFATYEYFANRPLKDAGGDELRMSGGSERSLSLEGIVLETDAVRIERVWRIVKDC